jgi:hypothetical protein
MVTTPASLRSDRPRAYGRFYLRAFISIVMVASLVVFTLSGLALFVAPSGQMANALDWRLAGLAKGQWEAVHIAFGLLWIPLAVVHLVFNRRVLGGYLRDRVRRTFVWRRELVAGILVTAGLSVAAIADLPPVVQVMQVEESFNAFWAERAPDVVTAVPTALGTAAGQGGGLGRFATVGSDGALAPLGKEAAARAVANGDGPVADAAIVADDDAAPVREPVAGP